MYHKRQSPRTWRKRRRLQPNSIHIIDQKIQGRSGGFWHGFGTTSEQREANAQYKKFSENLKQYILRVFQNPEDIIVLVRYLKDPTIVLNIPRSTALSSEDEKDPIMVMIQTEEINQFFKRLSTQRKNMIKLYRIIRGKCSPSLQREFEGDP